MKKRVVNVVSDHNSTRFNLICDDDAMKWMMHQIMREQNVRSAGHMAEGKDKFNGTLTITLNGATIKKSNLDRDMMEFEFVADDIDATIEVN